MTKELKDAVAAIEQHWFDGSEALKVDHLSRSLKYAGKRADFAIDGGPSMWEFGKNLELLELERSLERNAQMLLDAAEVVKQINKQETVTA